MRTTPDNYIHHVLPSTVLAIRRTLAAVDINNESLHVGDMKASYFNNVYPTVLGMFAVCCLLSAIGIQTWCRSGRAMRTTPDIGVHHDVRRMFSAIRYLLVYLNMKRRLLGAGSV